MKIPNLKERLSTRFKVDIPKPNFNCGRLVSSNVLDNETKVVSSSLEYKTINRSEEMRPYRCSDFSLHNLIAIGAPLNPSKMQTSPLAMADSLASTLESLPDSVFDNINNNND